MKNKKMKEMYKEATRETLIKNRRRKDYIFQEFWETVKKWYIKENE